MEENKNDSINLRATIRLIKKRKKLMFKVLALTLVLSVAYIMCIPRTYTCTITLAPESNDMGAEGLASMASSFGFDIGGNSSTDAIYPLLYPDAFASTDFVVSLFDIKVTTQDGSLTTDYYTYLTQHQEQTPWGPTLYKVKSSISNLIGDKEEAASGSGAGAGETKHDPFKLTKKETEVVQTIQQKIKCDVDKKTSVITITVNDQDPLISATLCDSVRVRLQKFITDYRTEKARSDLDHYKEIAQEAYEAYEKKAYEYAVYSDSHQNSILAMSNVQESTLENEMQAAYNAYTQFAQQVRMYEAKVLEKTPVFVVLQNATVPIKPSGPKRMIFVLAMLFFAGIGTSFYICKNIIFPKREEETDED